MAFDLSSRQRIAASGLSQRRYIPTGAPLVRRWPSVLRELPRRLLATGPGLAWLALRDAAQRPARFISTLHAQGIEVGLVAKLAGHANATVTLAHYTQAVRGGEVAIEALERAYGRQREAPNDGAYATEMVTAAPCR